MRRGAVEVLVAAFYYEQVSVLHTCVKVYAVVAEFFLQELNEYVALACLEPPAECFLSITNLKKR